MLQHDAEDNVHALHETDLLIQGDRIAKIGKNLQMAEDSQIIDCKGKIVSPGFVDTHHHVWQTQLKGRHSDDTLLDYTPKGTTLLGSPLSYRQSSAKPYLAQVTCNVSTILLRMSSGASWEDVSKRLMSAPPAW